MAIPAIEMVDTYFEQRVQRQLDANDDSFEAMADAVLACLENKFELRGKHRVEGVGKATRYKVNLEGWNQPTNLG